MSSLHHSDDGIPEAWSRILDAIAEGETAWSSPDEIISAVGLDEEAVLDRLAELDVEGLVDLWERPEGLAFTLSAYSAERFGFVLIEQGRFHELRWARLGDPEPESRPGGRGIRSDAMARARLVLDPHPGPESDAEQSETAARYLRNGRFGTFRRGAGRGEPPRPTLLIGGSHHLARPGSTGDPDEPCPCCGDRPLPAHAFCLSCDRWGLDGPDAPSFRAGRPARNPGAESARSHPERPDPSDRDRHRQEPRDRRDSNSLRNGRIRRTRRLERDRRRGIDHP